jgi:hypothetical protein
MCIVFASDRDNPENASICTVAKRRVLEKQLKATDPSPLYRWLKMSYEL